jgi:hypothetical protein
LSHQLVDILELLESFHDFAKQSLQDAVTFSTAFDDSEFGA